jgi:hypothetical protein
MTDDQKRIKIAEFCGWRMYYPTPKTIAEGRAGYEHWIDPDDYFGKWDGVPFPPDYLNDLNAIQKAIKRLTPEQRDRMARSLADKHAGSRGSGEWDEGFHEAVFATARERAEALLKVI